jgi:hypothetical protein
MLGALVFNFVIPAALHGFQHRNDPPSYSRVTISLPTLEGIAPLFSIPVGLILGFVIFQLSKRRMNQENATATDLSTYGVRLGLMLTYLNFPAYFWILNPEKNTPFRSSLEIFLMLGSTGALSGAWIAWQAWRSVHEEERFWPRFSLRTLVIVMIAWGAVLAAFAPK